jgi:hypothetical protein
VLQGGASWQSEGQPARRPHQYVRGGTAKLLTLFRPATGELRGEPVERTTNAIILHPWLKRELSAILKHCPSSGFDHLDAGTALGGLEMA